MPLVLDPLDTKHALESWSASEPLPQAVRTFGFIPDIERWKPGDLLLFSSISPGWISTAIIAAQARGFNPDHAQWHHAAVYIGRSRVCEATISGVRVASIYKYVPSHKIRARRCPILAAKVEGSYDVAVAALTRLPRAYSFATVASVWRNSLSGFAKLDLAMVQVRSHICSNLYTYSYSEVTSRLLERGAFPTPAALSASTDLVDVESRWKRLAS